MNRIAFICLITQLLTVTAPVFAADLKQIEVDLLEARYELNKSEENKIKLLRGIEEILEARCKDPEGKGIATRDFDNPELKDACKAWIDKATDLDKKNQIAHCIRDGSQSKNCKGLYGGPEPGELEPGTKGIIGRMERIDREKSKRPVISRTPGKAPSPEIIDSLTKMVVSNCPDRADLTAKISKECKLYSSQLFQYQPSNRLAQCYLQGLSSPACAQIEASEDSESEIEEGEEASSEEEDGFKGF